MSTLSNNQSKISSISAENIKDVDLHSKSIIEKLVNNMIFIESGIYTENIYAVKTFSGSLVTEAKPNTIEIESFYISKYPVSQKEWSLLMDYDPSEYTVSDEDSPVFNVSYEECLRFIAKLNRITGLKFDLPTSTQWDYAAHGGKCNDFHLSDKSYSEITEYAWIENTEPFPIGLKEPNSIGLHDMFGNIGELCKRTSSKDIIMGGKISSERIYSGAVINGYSIYNYEEYWNEKGHPDCIGFRLVCRVL